MRSDAGQPASPSPWYKEAVIYEIHVRAFADGDGDGTGDFKGLLGHLDYLVKLGVTAVWLLPFYPSPLKDDGYDISDYTNIHPAYGSLTDFKRFLRTAHEKGIRVITELVLNHTSDQHPWFTRARAAKPGSVARDFYVWSETPEKFRQARVIFSDFEQSNWTWDPVAKAYYWHRFYSHQPDLNYDNPAVKRAIFRVVDHWLSLGVDGLRLDAVPYLYKRRGTNCENLPQTHAFLKELRAYVDAKYPGRMLLAEANQWPEDAVNYFGSGDECHMAFHFPVMPRLFMALWMEDRHPIVDILEQTPAIPESCQWAIFLRNHDELTLEMVSDEERDYMYQAYARDAKSRINLGIRRRLAPLMQNNRHRMELINFLLFSFPATPIIYYGDELGMGDNYHLGDRNGVRTPMQWSPDRNAGFSKANPQSLFLPVIIDPEYHFEVVNVETAERNPSSFLWWMRRLIAAYKREPALGGGTLEFVKSENTKVLSFLRIHREDYLLVVVNLSRFAQVAELDLSRMAGTSPVEVFGQTRFPVIGTGPYVLTLGPHDHFWFKLDSPPRAEPERGAVPPAFCLRMQTEGSNGKNGLPGMDLAVFASGKLGVLSGTGRFRDLTVIASLAVESPDCLAHLTLTECAFGQKPHGLYLFFLSRLSNSEVADRLALTPREPSPVYPSSAGEDMVMADGFRDREAIRALLATLGSRRGTRGDAPGFHVVHSAAPGERKSLVRPSPNIRLIRETGQTLTYSCGDEVFLKIFRRPEAGRHAEEEILSLLARKNFPEVPRLITRLTYAGFPEGEMTLALVTSYIRGAVAGTEYIEGALNIFFERVLASTLPPPRPEAVDIFAGPGLAHQELELIGGYILDFFRRLGERCAALHKVLGGDSSPGFRPEPFTKLYARSLYQSMRNMTHRAVLGIDRLRQLRDGQEAPVQKLPQRVLIDHFARLLTLETGGMRIRIHGDFQLENVLHAGKDFMLVDFDGDVRLPLGERRIKRSPLRDVACMVLSIIVAGSKALARHATQNPADALALTPWLMIWQIAACRSFVTSYLEAARDAGFLPESRASLQLILGVLLFEQTLRNIIREIEDGAGEVAVLLDILGRLVRIFP